MQYTEDSREFLVKTIKLIDDEIAERKPHVDRLEKAKAKHEKALKVLDADEKPKPNAKGKAAKKSPKQKDVREVALAFVVENPGIKKAELEGLTKQKLKDELGFDLKGFEMRWNEVLNSGTFAIAANDRVSIASPKADQVVTTTVCSSTTPTQLPVER